MSWLTRRPATWAIRMAGIVVLAVLMVRLDLGQVSEALLGADPLLVAIAVALIVPLIYIKTVRWQRILKTQSVDFGTWPALLAYFGSLFVGFITPGRLGEFVRAIHVNRDCGLSHPRAFSTVLTDRLFDLYLLLPIAGAALIGLAANRGEALSLAGLAVLAVVPLVLLLNGSSFKCIRGALERATAGRLRRLAPVAGWLEDVRSGIRALNLAVIAAAVVLTLAAYALFFGQAYMLAVAVGLEISYFQLVLVLALSSPASLLPISISGLGTREAVIVGYLGVHGVQAESALAFSLLVFATFYVGGGLIGVFAWWLKPVPLARPGMAARSATSGS